jgi:DNA topoisomerase-1
MLSDDEQKLYTLIWERFVACQMNPALYDSVAVTVVTSSGHNLKANGRVLKYKGWLEITSDLDNDDSDLKLPLLKKNDKLELVPPKVKASQKFTKPPSRFTEQTLVKALKKKGIGRPSTYAAIMGKITHKSYVVKKSSAFVPTDRGKEVVDSLTKFFKFMNYDYTAEMEVKLDQIAEGKLDYVGMLTSFYTPFKKQLKTAFMSEHKDYGFTCDKCDSMMILRHTPKYGFFLGCSGYPDCKSTLNCEVVDGKPVVSKKKTGNKELVPGVKCPICKAGMYESAGKWGPFYSCSEYYNTKCKGTRKVPYGKKCSDCGGELYATIYNEEDVLFCMNSNCYYKEKMPKGKLANPKKLLGEKLPKNIKKMIK